MSQLNPVVAEQRENIVIQELIRTGSVTAAGQAAYPNQTPESARTSAGRILRKAEVRARVEAEMEALGITPRAALVPVREGLEARWRGDPDFGARLKAADMALKLMDAYPDERIIQEQPGGQQYHLHLREPAHIVRWIAQTGRYPTHEERGQLEGASNAETATEIQATQTLDADEV